MIDNSGLIPFDQAFFAFEVEGPIDSLKGVPTWDEIEHYLDNPYAFELDNVDVTIYPTPWVLIATTSGGKCSTIAGAHCSPGATTDVPPPDERVAGPSNTGTTLRTCRAKLTRDPASTSRCCGRSSSAGADGILGNADDQSCQPGSAGCVEVPHLRHLVHPLNYNYQGGEELRLLNIDYAGGVS
jgi:hypothetical protein